MWECHFVIVNNVIIWLQLVIALLSFLFLLIREMTGDRLKAFLLSVD